MRELFLFLLDMHPTCISLQTGALAGVPEIGMHACRWVAQFFTWGSVVWCVNVRRAPAAALSGFAPTWCPILSVPVQRACLKDVLIRQMAHGAPAQGWYALFPLSNTTTNANIVGWTGLVGGTLFEIGAYCMVVEALNRGNTVRFGYEARPHSDLICCAASGLSHAGCSGKRPPVLYRKEYSEHALDARVQKEPSGVQVRHLMEAGLTHFYRTRSRGADFYSPDGAEGGQVEHLMQIHAIGLPLAVPFHSPVPPDDR